MANKIKQFIKITITGYIPAANILDKKSINEQFDRLSQIKNLAHENLEMCEVATKPVNKTVDVKPNMGISDPVKPISNEEE